MLGYNLSKYEFVSLSQHSHFSTTTRPDFTENPNACPLPSTETNRPRAYDSRSKLCAMEQVQPRGPWGWQLSPNSTVMAAVTMIKKDGFLRTGFRGPSTLLR